mgnify:CR=1 FL=1
MRQRLLYHVHSAGGIPVTRTLTDQMNSAGYRAEVVSAYQTAGGAPYLDYTDTVLGQVYEGMDGGGHHRSGRRG